MSVRTFEYRSKKRDKHNSSRKTKNPSYFPRHLVNKFEGDHLSMTANIDGKYWTRYNYAYIPSSRVEDIIIKFIGLPYTDMCKELHRKFKECKTNFKYDIDEELAHFFNTSRWGYSPIYAINKDGNVIRLKELRNEGLHLSPSQIRWNKSQPIPDWGAVCKPRVADERYYWHTVGPYRYDKGSPASGSNIGDFYQPKLIGEYWCIVHKNIVKLPVYHVQQGQSYLNWNAETKKSIWDSEKGTYITVSPNPKYSDTFRSGVGKHAAEIFESTWTVPYIYMGKYSSWSTSIPYLFHSHKVEGENPEYERILNSIKSAKNLLVSKFAQNNMVYRLEREKDLAHYEIRLRVTPKTCMLEAGYGQLYPLVRESDYRKYMGI